VTGYQIFDSDYAIFGLESVKNSLEKISEYLERFHIV
jgi:hypothetical protein